MASVADTMATRALSPVGDAELERRWAALRTAMAAAGLDAVLTQATNDWLVGTVKWLTDLPATNGYPRTVLFFTASSMVVVEMGRSASGVCWTGRTRCIVAWRRCWARRCS